MRKSLLALAGGMVCTSAVLGTLLAAEGPYTIAYATFAPLNTAIFIANGDGSHERMLLPDARFDSNPAFSLDGRWVLFSSRRHGSVDIYRVRVDGTHFERLTDDVAFDDQPVMSPDGRHVAFVSSRSGQADIWLLDLQARGVRNLTNHPGGDYRPAEVGKRLGASVLATLPWESRDAAALSDGHGSVGARTSLLRAVRTASRAFVDRAPSRPAVPAPAAA